MSSRGRPAAASGNGELLPQGEIVEEEGLSGKGERANTPEDQFEEQKHRVTMRDLSADGNGRRL